MQARLLYIDDDLIDRMTLERQLQQQNYWKFDIISSLKEVPKNTLYDMVLCDRHLEEGNSNEVIQYFHPVPVILVSGENIKSSQEYKPHLKPLILHDILYKIYTLNLSKIEEIVDGDTDAKSLLIQTVESELKKDFGYLQVGVANQDIENVKFYAHKMKSKINLLQIPCFNESTHSIEDVETIRSGEFAECYFKTKMLVHIALYQLEIYTKKWK